MKENYSCLNVATPGNEPGSVSSKNKAINSVGDGLNMGQNSPNVSSLKRTYDRETLADKYESVARSKMFNTDMPKKVFIPTTLVIVICNFITVSCTYLTLSCMNNQVHR